jgi:hypothetical protein
MSASEAPGSNTRQRRARLWPEWARHMHGVQPGTWYAVLEDPPSEIQTPPLVGHMWIEVQGRPQCVQATLRSAGEAPDAWW